MLQSWRPKLQPCPCVDPDTAVPVNNALSIFTGYLGAINKQDVEIVIRISGDVLFLGYIGSVEVGAWRITVCCVLVGRQVCAW